MVPRQKNGINKRMRYVRENTSLYAKQGPALPRTNRANRAPSIEDLRREEELFLHMSRHGSRPQDNKNHMVKQHDDHRKHPENSCKTCEVKVVTFRNLNLKFSGVVKIKLQATGDPSD